MRTATAALVVLGAFAVPPSVRADFFATYNFAGLPGNEYSVSADPATYPSSRLSFSDITRGPSLTPVAGLNSINSSGFPTSTALSDNYYQFTVTAPSVDIFRIDSITVTLQRNATGPTNVEFAYYYPTGNVNVILDDVQLTTTNNTQVVVPTGPQGLILPAAPFYFRIYATSAQDSTGTLQLGVNDSAGNSNLPDTLVVHGEPIPNLLPEPGAFTLLGIGLTLGMVLLRGR